MVVVVEHLKLKEGICLDQLWKGNSQIYSTFRSMVIVVMSHIQIQKEKEKEIVVMKNSNMEMEILSMCLSLRDIINRDQDQDQVILIMSVTLMTVHPMREKVLMITSINAKRTKRRGLVE